MIVDNARPCPFCEGTEIAFESGYHDDPYEQLEDAFLFCCQCDAQGPSVPIGNHNKIKATMLWNKRDKNKNEEKNDK